MPAKRFILVAEHDAAVRAALVELLRDQHGFAVTTAGTLRETDAAIDVGDVRFDALILDMAMPDGDGADYCARLRSLARTTSVIMLTGPDVEADIVRGLDAGANDYIAKPFRFGELIARLRTQWRITDGRQEVAFTLGPYIFRPAAKLLFDPIRKTRIPVTTKEAAILRLLIQSDGRPVPREVLLRDVWGYSADAATHTLETHMHRLRRKLEPQSRRPGLLRGEQGGYRLDLTAWSAEET